MLKLLRIQEAPRLAIGSVKHHTNTIIPISPEYEAKAKRAHDCPTSWICGRSCLQIHICDPKALCFPFDV